MHEQIKAPAPVQGYGSGLVFTRLTNSRGALTKTYTVNRDDPNGKPVSNTRANLFEGFAETVHCADLPAFMALLDVAQKDQAFAYGVTGHDRVEIVTKDKLAKGMQAIARSREHFNWRRAPGIWMLDHDAGYLPTAYDDAESLRDALLTALPALDAAPMGWTPSASSYLLNEATGQQVKGPAGARLYIPVEDVSDTPRAMKALREYLWAAGIGSYSVSKAGTLIERTLFDLGTTQPERLDFVAGANCIPPLVQQRPAWQLFESAALGGYDPVPLHLLVPDPEAAVRQAADENRALARKAVEQERQRVRGEYKAQRVQELIQRGVAERAASDCIESALERRQLFAEFVLYPEGGGQVTVGEVLDDPKRWHGARFADPLEPDYGNDGRIAYAHLRSGGRPHITSHAHGGQRFELFRQPATLQVLGGDEPRLADACVDLMREQQVVFDGPADGMLRVAEGRIYQVSQPWLQDHLGRIASFQRFDRRAKAVFPVSVPPAVTTAILAREGQRGLPVLNAVVTAPTLRDDGTVLDVPGYDVQSGILYTAESLDVPRVPQAPKFDEVLLALQELWRPISLFPYDGPESRGVALAAMLTSCIRRALPTSPAFAIDAPAAGTGKTLLARCIALVGGHNTDTTPLPQPEEERRKLIFALLRRGDGCMTFDNISGALGGDAFDQAMTSPMYSSRVLGESRSESVPNRSLVLVTGNNVQTQGDTHRRVLRCRINANTERPYLREFEFNPAQMIEANRLQLVAAALTVIRGYLVADRKKGCLASFEEWDGLVRNTVLWLAANQREISLGDPVHTITEAEDEDTSRGSVGEFFCEWHRQVGAHPITARELLERAGVDDFDAPIDATDRTADGADARAKARAEAEAARCLRQLLTSALRGESRRTGDITPRELGDWLRRSKDLIAGEFQLVHLGSTGQKVAQWAVRRCVQSVVG